MRRIVLSVAIAAALMVVLGSLDTAEAGRRRCSSCGPCAGGACTVAIVPSATSDATAQKEAPAPKSNATAEAKADETQPAAEEVVQPRTRTRLALFRRYRG